MTRRLSTLISVGSRISVSTLQFRLDLEQVTDLHSRISSIQGPLLSRDESNTVPFSEAGDLNGEVVTCLRLIHRFCSPVIILLVCEFLLFSFSIYR